MYVLAMRGEGRGIFLGEAVGSTPSDAFSVDGIKKLLSFLHLFVFI
jgi:hypothetical protein